MSAPSLVAGVDCSTQATKVLIVDAADGTVVAEGRAPHEVSGTDGARETHPHVWRDALRDALAQTGRAGDVAAVAIAGQQHGMVTLDDDGMPIRPAPLWNDTRAAPDAERLIEELGGAEPWAVQIGVVPVASFTASKWAWLRRTEPEHAAATRHLRLPHDYLTELLCGRAVTDRGDASGTAWWTTATGDYAIRVLELPSLQLDPDMLPTVLGPGEPAGEITAEAAATFGLPAGAAVAAGTGDNMGAALGLGLRPGVPVVSLGTSGTAYAVSDTRVVDPSGLVAGFADATGRFLPLAATLNCTLAVDRVAGWLGIDREDVAATTDVVVLPYFDGERTPNLPDAAASFHGLRHSTTPQEILLAAYQGAAASLLMAIDRLSAVGSGVFDDAPIGLIGGGAKGSAWRQVIADLSQRRVVAPDAQELVALGAAAQAAALLREEPAEAIARGWGTTAGEEVEPARDTREALARIRAMIGGIGS